MKVVSFFAGCGGLDLGFEQAGFQVVWANEIEPHCRATYVRNHPSTELVIGDICEMDPTIIPDCDGFIGGPPCQSWSVGGKQKGLDDKRGSLFLKYIELIRTKRPKFFVIENVKGMLDAKFKDVFADFVTRLDNAGYDVHWSLLDAADYRIPQNRERVFFVGFKKNMQIRYSFPEPMDSGPISLARAIGDITVHPNFLTGNKTKDTIKCDLKIGGHYNHDVLTSKFGPFYLRGNRRRGWHQPSFTINATAEFTPLHPSSPKMVYFGHENWNFQKDRLNEYRRLSVRECARIQTFPDTFVFEYEDIKAAYRMIGNAVPPRLGHALAKSILNSFDSDTPSRSPHDGTDDRRQKLSTTNSKETVLVGYYKGESHRRLILGNKLYYVRSDGRKGSMFKEDCQTMPKYLLLHHKEKFGLYELDEDEPILADSLFLKSLGFEASGDNYLLFRLKSTESISIHVFGANEAKPKYDENDFTPNITTIDKIF